MDHDLGRARRGPRADASMQEIHFPHSLGLLYSAFTYYTGFKVNSGEYKVMGLAPYGEPRFVDLIKEHLIDIKDDGTFRLNLEYFDYCTGLTHDQRASSTSCSAAPARKPEEPPDAARDGPRRVDPGGHRGSRAQARARRARKDTGEKNLCLAGGVALNCVANGKLLRDGCFEQHLDAARGRRRRRRARRGAGRLSPASSSASASVERRHGRACAAATSGPQFANDEIERRLQRRGRGVRSARPTTQLIDALRRRAGRRQGARLVPGPHGVRPARARRPLDPRRRRARRRCRSSSTSRSSTASRSGRSRRRCWREDAPKYFEHRRREPVHAAGRRRGGASIASR